MANKRRFSVAADNGWVAPPEKRPRTDSGIPRLAEPPSPRWWLLRKTFLVALFVIRAKDRNMYFSLAQIGRVVREQFRHCLDPIVSKLESMDGRIRALTQKVDNITSNSHNGHNHERCMQGTNQEGTNDAEAQGSAKTETKGKEASIRLRFYSEMKPPVYHDDEIESLRIGIFDGDTVIKSGPLSELEIEMLALEGSFPHNLKSWTSKEFHEHIAYGRDGKGNVLAGKGTKAQLINGECQLHGIRFREGSCRARGGMFIIGVKVCDGQEICGRVQEAVTNPVVVQDRRNKYNEKSHPPKPDDEVYRLEKIAINGKYRERLEKENILTVEHFLKALYKDKDNLARILQIKKKSKDWEKMVDHAQQCCLQGKPELKLYRCEERNVVLCFNHVHRLVGARFGSRYIASDKFDSAQQNLVEKLKKNAYDQLDGLSGDHIMVDNTPFPNCMNTDGGAGPSYATSATLQKNSGHHIAAHHVAGTLTSEVRSPCTPPEPLCENVNNDHGLNSIPDPNITHDYQAVSIPADEGLRHGPNESQFAIANDVPSTSFSFPDHPTTQNYHDQGTGLADMEQLSVFDDILNNWDYGQTFSAACDFHPLAHGEADESLILSPQEDTNIWGAPVLHQGEMQSYAGWTGTDTLEPSASAPIHMVSMAQLLNNTGAPGSGQWSMQNEAHALPGDGTTGLSSGSAQQAIPPQQSSHNQGNMPGNTSF